ncbi:MAG: ABC-F family ATP-binding cassette domain-containing protein [Oligoflexia bacterium]|nr:ABC-F family ATP-binding cassette domain-containing protein [Oligoflexia bacterium]
MAASPLLNAHQLSKAYGVNPLFQGITLTVTEGERACLIGPNGSGKSTLLRIMAGLDHADEGTVRPRSGLRLVYVPQEDVFDESLTIAKTLELALVTSGHDEHEVEGKISIMCGRFGFSDKSALVSTLSGGWRKRLALARGMILDPELLLLDEPTNHLDIEGVLWLESFLARLPAALLFVSHDRYFIERLALRVIEINRQYPRGFFSSNGGYADFLEARSAFLAGLHQSKESLENRVRREVAWLRRGAKARTTKAKSRIDQAGELMEELKGFKLEEKRAELDFSASKRKTQELIKLEGVSKGFESRILFSDISLTVSPGMRLGIVGPNGSGKSTFIKTLLGEIKPDRGRVVRANKLRTAFFDQGRKQLDESLTLQTALCPHGDGVVFRGKQMHVAGWAGRFLFSRDQLSLPVKSLSGGEQARLLLAKLMLEETDILLFDEPTNDLDIKTLEVLEESFSEYPGAIVLITHDRYLLDRTATTVLGLGDGKGHFYGDYLQWELQRKTNRDEPAEKETRPAADGERARPELTKLSYNEQRELNNIERDIIKAEDLLRTLEAAVASPELLAKPLELRESYQKLSVQQQAVETLYNRWQELEQRKRDFQLRKIKTET